MPLGFGQNSVGVDLLGETVLECGPGVGGKLSAVVEAVETVGRRSGAEAALGRSEFLAQGIPLTSLICRMALPGDRVGLASSLCVGRTG
jgi:hypothetical protein